MSDKQVLTQDHVCDNFLFFGERIKSLRTSKKFTLEKMAENCGITKSYLHDLESGRKDNPSIWIVARISEQLDISIDDLINNDFFRLEDVK